MSNQNTPTNTLREQICSIFNVFPDELGYDLPGGIGLKKVEQLEALISQAVNKAELACAVYMEPGRFQDYKNRRDGTFQNDPRLNRDETPKGDK